MPEDDVADDSYEAGEHFVWTTWRGPKAMRAAATADNWQHAKHARLGSNVLNVLTMDMFTQIF